MQIVITAYLDESRERIEESTRLVDLYQNKDFAFVSTLIAWLSRSEALMKQYRRGELGAISALRARALAAQAGVQQGGQPSERRLQARRQSAGACALILGEAQALLGGVHTALEAKRDEASRLIQQMLQILIQNGSLAPLLAAPPAQRVTPIWQSCLSRPEVATGARQVLGLVSWPDALRLIDETLAAWRL